MGIFLGNNIFTSMIWYYKALSLDFKLEDILLNIFIIVTANMTISISLKNFTSQLMYVN